MWRNNLQLFLNVIWFFYLIAIVKCEINKGFLATFPTTVLSGGEADLCVRFFNIEDDVIIDIQDSEPSAFPRMRKTISPNIESCFKLQIKPNVLQEKQLKQITISGQTVDGNYKFNETKYFGYKTQSSITFIETDKPVYKPGDLVQIRILTLDFELKPHPKTYSEIFIEDSSNTRVHQWTNIASNISFDGIITLELPISEEPNFGIWKITANERLLKSPLAKASFEVKKYVLPRFELNIDTQNHILMNNNSLNVKVCAKYSFGKDVKGLLNLTLYSDRYFYTKTAILKTLSNQKLKGCQFFAIPCPHNLQQLKYDGYYTLKINGTFKEEQTNLIAKVSSNEIEIADKKYKFELLEPSYYKPGLPCKIKIQVKTQDNAPAAYKILDISVNRVQSEILKDTYTTDKNGIVSFSLDTSCKDNEECAKNGRADMLSIRVKVSEKTDGNLRESSTSWSLRSWHSKEGLYLQIYKPQQIDENDCVQKVTVDIKIRLDHENVENPELYNTPIHFQIQARSRVFYAGYYDKTTKTLKLTLGEDNEDITFRKAEIEEIEDIEEKKKRKRDINLDTDPCGMEKDEGDGTYSKTYWYYNSESGKCEEFIYRGLYGNVNRFEDETACIGKCVLKNTKRNVEKLELKEDPMIEHYELTFPITEDHSPEIQVLVFQIVNGEVIPDNIKIKIPKCLKNMVHLRLGETHLHPGDNLSISIVSAPKSLCTISAIDKSVTFMGKKKNIDLEKVFENLQEFSLEYDYYNVYKTTETNCFPTDGGLSTSHLAGKRSIAMNDYAFFNFYDTTEAFKDSNLVIFTDLKYFKWCEAISGTSFLPDALPPKELEQIPSEAAKPTTEIVRQFFPETWLWQIHKLDDRGNININTKVPDSITDWIFDSYCLSHAYSLGVSKPVTLNVFQPFFISLNLPYSVIKDETFPIQASVFNYMDKCIPVTISLILEKNLELVDKKTSTIQTCVCEEDKLTHTFFVKALEFDLKNGVKVTAKVTSSQNSKLCEDLDIAKISYSDSETRTVIVEPEGIQKEITKSAFIVLDGNNTSYNEMFQIGLPSNVIPKSVRAEFSIIGDAIGPSITNLNKLVQIPTGCGEQNMVKFAPLVSIVKYLKDSGQLTNKLSKTAGEYIKIGYQKQLTYRHNDGSYSAFGKADKEGGGTWLTAFVLRCFAQSLQIKEIIEVDQQDIVKSFNWLLNIQNNDGSFPQVGTQLLSKALSGGLSEKKVDGLTAYVMVSLLTTINSLRMTNYSKERITKGLEYMKKSVSDIHSTDSYTLALTLYALKLANDGKLLIKEIEDELELRTIKQNGAVYWDLANEIESNPEESQKPANIETTSYVLLAKLLKYNKQSLTNLPPIAKWINSQRNSLGGFFSTQDTVVALEALSKYASAFYSKRIMLQTSYSLNDEKVNSYIINQNNRLLLKTFKLDTFVENDDNTFKLQVNGSGSGLAQINIRYNIKEETDSRKNFRLDLEPEKSNLGPECQYARIKIKTFYTGDRDASDMTIVSLRLPTGWMPHEPSVMNLQENSRARLKRHEINENRLNFYFDEIPTSGKEFSFDVTKVFEIKNRKPGVISIYDYYDSQDNALSYEFEVAENCE